MPHTASRSERATGRALVAIAVAASWAALLGGCGGGGGGPPPPVDLARLDVCVLTGQQVSNGCNTDGSGNAQIALGDMAMGDQKSVVVALYDGAGGDVPAVVSAATLDSTGSTANYSLALFTLAGAVETPATLPFALTQNHGTELRARVTYNAYAPVGPVSGVSLKIAMSHPVTQKPIPVVGNITGCPTGKGDCDNDPTNGCETDLQTDLLHCGACATACSTVNGTPSCTAGACSIACAAGFADCDLSAATGCEVTLATDPLHCGSCTVACDSTNGTASCSGGACGISCAAGFADCDNNPANGCEVTLATDLLHCGSCLTACSSTNGTASCTGGACGISCATGWGDCDGLVSTGCETDLTSSVAHCGACANACNSTNGTASCTNSVCAITCNAGFADCDGLASTGCEVNTTSDPLHCGACATACNGTNGTPTCTGSVCGITCNAGFANCDGLASTGCEVHTASDVANCGGCGLACNATNGTASCTASVCGIACNPGFANCDGLASTGCEVDTLNDPNNCGGCGLVCNSTNGTATCTAGVCGITCAPGFADCDGLASTGCEVNTTSDVAHCGACANACNSTNGTASCTNSVCGITCNAGFADCDGLASTGCEVNTTSDPANCGACATACNSTNGTASCTASVCGITCNPGFANCDGLASTGCEVNTTNDVANCGACGTLCSAAAEPHVTGVACSASACVITACAATWYDVDRVYLDGCECQADAVADACGGAQAIGSLAVGMTASFNANITPNSDVDWYAVSLQQACNSHASVVLNDPSTLLRMDVLGSCTGGGLSCADGAGTGVTSWENLSCCPGAACLAPNLGPGQLFVRVYAVGSSTSCLPYTITFSD